MRITTMKSDNYLNALIESIKALMLENGITEIPMEDTIFGKKSGWEKIVLKDDKVCYISTSYGKTFCIELKHIHRWDIIALQEIIYGKVEKMFVEEI
jgi:hypothetical protein